ncbi:MAG: Crp/Fnr family transcriptional regulator [Hyphomicrobiaceae bacterium]|nr:Crp/Fnr family transcriptional regulator [Hyphomicrobiaceae bacterium]
MADHRRTLELLGGTSLFGGLQPAVLGAVGAAMQDARFSGGQLIFSRGDPGNAIYLVREGRVRLSILTADGRELSFAHALPGDIFGEIAVLDGSPRSADATALGDVVALALPAATCHRLIEQHPGLARAVIRLLCARLREVSDHLEDIALLPIEARLARYFLNRLPTAAASSATPLQKLELAMSQSELALLLGASRPKVNAAIMALEQAGAIRRAGQAFEADVPLLSEIARRE